MVLLKLIFRKELKTTVHISGKFRAIDDEKSLLKDKPLRKNSLIVLADVVLLFVIQGAIGKEVSIIAWWSSNPINYY
jgi:Na+/H+ antiporter NhaD/arsenite permease-like protein